jgi:hypothetical protein
MKALFLCLTAVCLMTLGPMSTALADDQLTVHKVQLAGPSGTINGKVIGVADYLIFVDDDTPDKSFLIPRGQIRTARNTEQTVVVEMSRPVTDRFGTRSNVEIRFIDPAAASVVTKWIGVPVERARTVLTYSLDVRHDHKGEGGCDGKLIADENRLRFESVTEASHSRTWNYNTLSQFEAEKDHALLKVTARNGESYHFNIVNGATAGEMHRLVSEKIVAARP